MAEYTAPLRDMKFVIKELTGLEAISSLPGCVEVAPDLVDAVLEEAGKFATGVLSPLNAPGDRNGCKLQDGVVTTPPGFKDAYRQFREAGWPALSCDPHFGGQGLPFLLAHSVSEIWNGANMGFCLGPMLTSGAVHAVERHSTDALKQRYLPKLVSGEWMGTMNLTEPQAGSDLSAVRARAVPEGDHYRIHGTKIFITYGEHDWTDNVVHLVLARLPDAPEGVKGISLFLVPKFLVNPDGSLDARNDVKCVSIEHKLGIHASPTCVMAYGEKDGAIGYLVGGENRGLEHMFTMMNFARLEVGIEGIALGERAYQRALAYARERVQGRETGARSGDRVTIIHHPDVRRMLMSMKAQVEAMRALSALAAQALDISLRHADREERQRHQAVVDLLTPVVKGWCTEQGIEIASLGVQVHGGMGFIEETGAAQHLRDARIATIYEGTTGIQANDLTGRKLAAEKGMTAKAVIAQIRAFDRELAGAGSHPALGVLRRNLADGVGALTEATEWLLETFPHNARAATAGSVPYLKLWGTVAGAWQMARAALIAKRALDAGAEDDTFYRAKLATARFFAEHCLPLAQAYKQAIVHGSASVLALDEAEF
jgi:alkylation response protein AidB-like acyl-CoA dehydrogenase